MRMNIRGPGEVWASPIGNGTIKDYEICKWPSGKIYIRYLLEDMLKLLAEDMHKNVRNGYDNLVVIEGPEGSGKSNFAYNLLNTYCNLNGSEFDLQSQYVYNTNAFKEILKKGEDAKNAFWMDEATNMANNRDWNTNDSKSLIMLLETMRSRGWLCCLCIPTHERLDVYIREHRMKYLIRCAPMDFERVGHKDRGYFEVKKRNPYGKLETIGYGEYPQMPAEVKAEYERIKLESQTTMINEVVNGADTSAGSKYNKMYNEKCKQMDSIMLQLYNSGYDPDGLMELFGIENRRTFMNKLSKARHD